MNQIFIDHVGSYVQVPWGVCVEVFLEYFALYSIGCTVYSIVFISIRLFPDFRPENTNSSLQGCVLSRPIQTLYV